MKQKEILCFSGDYLLLLLCPVCYFYAKATSVVKSQGIAYDFRYQSVDSTATKDVMEMKVKAHGRGDSTDRSGQDYKYLMHSKVLPDGQSDFVIRACRSGLLTYMIKKIGSLLHKLKWFYQVAPKIISYVRTTLCVLTISKRHVSCKRH